MATNDFQTFAGDPAANVMTQANYIASGFTARLLGFSTGTALSIQLNKVWRQSSLITHMIGQFAVDQSGADMLDDGTPSGLTALETNFTNAIRTVAVAAVGTGYLPLTGGVLSGGLTINASPALIVNAPLGASMFSQYHRQAGQTAQIASFTGAVQRWGVTIADAALEQGSNTGSNFSINRFADSNTGTAIDSPLTISRATGVVNFTVAPTVAGGSLPYLPIAGGVLLGQLGVGGQGVTYPNLAVNFSSHRTAFGWDGSYIVASVDGTNVGQLASVAWANGVIGGYLPLGGGTITGNLTVNQQLTVYGTLWGNSTVVFAGLSDFSNFQGSGYRYRQWAGNWYDFWNSANGMRGWHMAGGSNMTLDGGCNLHTDGVMSAYGGRVMAINGGITPAIACWNTGAGTAMGMWNDTHLWFGSTDGNGQPSSGFVRIQTSGVMEVWNGFYSYNFAQISQWASVGGNLWANNSIFCTGHTLTRSSGQPTYSLLWDNGSYAPMGIFEGGYGYGLEIGQCDWNGNPQYTEAYVTNGGYVVAGVGFSTFSSRDLKDNIRPSPNFDSLGAIRKLRTKSYSVTPQRHGHLPADGDAVGPVFEPPTSHIEHGLIGEEVAEILPDVADTEVGMMSIKLVPLIVHACRAIAQLADRLDQMEAAR